MPPKGKASAKKGAAARKKRERLERERLEKERLEREAEERRQEEEAAAERQAQYETEQAARRAEEEVSFQAWNNVISARTASWKKQTQEALEWKRYVDGVDAGVVTERQPFEVALPDEALPTGSSTPTLSNDAAPDIAAQLVGRLEPNAGNLTHRSNRADHDALEGAAAAGAGEDGEGGRSDALDPQRRQRFVNAAKESAVNDWARGVEEMVINSDSFEQAMEMLDAGFANLQQVDQLLDSAEGEEVDRLAGIRDIIVRAIDNGIAAFTGRAGYRGGDFADSRGQVLLSHRDPRSGWGYGLWVNLGKAPRTTLLAFDALGVKVDVPKHLALSGVAVRAVHLPPWFRTLPQTKLPETAVLGATMVIETFQLPAQPKEVKGWTLRPLPASDEPSDLRLVSVPYPPEEGGSATQYPPLQVFWDVPKMLVFPDENPHLATWDAEAESWAELPAADVKFAEGRLEVPLASTGSVAMTAQRFAQHPFKSFLIYPTTKPGDFSFEAVRSEGVIVELVTANDLIVSIMCGEGFYRLDSIGKLDEPDAFASATQTLQLRKYPSATTLIRQLDNFGLNIVGSEAQKLPAFHTNVYRNLSRFAMHFAFCSSNWTNRADTKYVFFRTLIWGEISPEAWEKRRELVQRGKAKSEPEPEPARTGSRATSRAQSRSASRAGSRPVSGAPSRAGSAKSEAVSKKSEPGSTAASKKSELAPPGGKLVADATSDKDTDDEERVSDITEEQDFQIEDTSSKWATVCVQARTCHLCEDSEDAERVSTNLLRGALMHDHMYPALLHFSGDDLMLVRSLESAPVSVMECVYNLLMLVQPLENLAGVQSA